MLSSLFGAHDADRTRDLVLTKDVLYQLSYVGTPPSEPPVVTSNLPLDFKTKLERAMGFEPTTASLEGWNSTTELRPLKLNYQKTFLDCV